jgi:hypothetical protein
MHISDGEHAVELSPTRKLAIHCRRNSAAEIRNHFPCYRQKIKGRCICTAPQSIYPDNQTRYGPMFAGWHAEIEAGTGGAGGVDHGTALKSKNSSRFGCAASRLVKCAEELMKRLSTNLITAV